MLGSLFGFSLFPLAASAVSVNESMFEWVVALAYRLHAFLRLSFYAQCIEEECKLFFPLQSTILLWKALISLHVFGVCML